MKKEDLIDDEYDDEELIVENEPEIEDVSINKFLEKENYIEFNVEDKLIQNIKEEDIKNIPLRFENALLLNEEVKKNDDNSGNQFKINPRPKISPFLLFINPKSGTILLFFLLKFVKEFSVFIRRTTGRCFIQIVQRTFASCTGQRSFFRKRA